MSCLATSLRASAVRTYPYTVDVDVDLGGVVAFYVVVERLFATNFTPLGGTLYFSQIYQI